MTDFTVISTKNVPIGEGTNVDFKKGTTRVKGKDTSHYALIFPLGSPNLKEAIDKTIQQTPGAIGLVDGVVKSKFWHCILYGQSSYIVEGTPLFPVERQTASFSEHKPSNGSFNQDDSLNQSKNVNNFGEKSGQLHSSVAGLSEQSAQPDLTVSSGIMVFYHKVKEGESLIDIAKAYGVKVSDLIKWNNLNNNNLTKGQSLTILYSE